MYFTEFVYNTAPKNKLEKELLEFVQSQDRILIDQVDWYKTHFSEIVSKLNEIHNRCKPIKPEWFNRGEVIYLHNTGFITFKIMKVEKYQDKMGLEHFGKWQNIL